MPLSLHKTMDARRLFGTQRRVPHQLGTFDNIGSNSQQVSNLHICKARQSFRLLSGLCR